MFNMKTKITTLILCVCTLTICSQLSNELIWSTGTFYPKTIKGITLSKDGNYYTSIEQDKSKTEIVKYNYKSNKKVATLFSNISFNKFEFSDYKLSNDQNWLLLFNSKESIYRRSSKSFYYLYNIKKNILKPLADSTLGKQRLASFSPDNRKVAYVRDNNIYYKYLSDTLEIPITNNGEINMLINGATDWVYEEEFSIHKGFFWSPDGSKIAYYVFDERDVKQFEMEMYGNLYPSQYKFKYPKAGEDNSLIAVKVFDLDNLKTYDFDIGENPDIYIPRMIWSMGKNELIVFKMNRLQNNLELLSGKFNNQNNPISSVKINKVYSETSSTYIDIHDNTFFINKDEFIWTSEKDGFNHIYLINYSNNTERKLTSGEWDVTNVYGYNSKDKTIYFQAAKKSPTDREIYSLDLKTNQINKISSLKGTNDADFSSDFQYFINTYSDANHPLIFTLNNKKGKVLKVLEDNKKLSKRMDEYDLVEKTFFKIPNVLLAYYCSCITHRVTIKTCNA